MQNQNVDKGLDLQMFVNRLMEEKKFPESLKPDALEQIKADLLSRVEDRINALIINNLSEENLDIFNKMLDEKGNDTEIQAFCEKCIPDLAQLIATELTVFRQTYLS